MDSLTGDNREGFGGGAWWIIVLFLFVFMGGGFSENGVLQDYGGVACDDQTVGVAGRGGAQGGVCLVGSHAADVVGGIFGGEGLFRDVGDDALKGESQQAEHFPSAG